MNEKVLGSEFENSPSEKVITNDSVHQNVSNVKTQDLASSISKSTSQGGLQMLPEEFDVKDGHWLSIRSDNPFGRLYFEVVNNHLRRNKMVLPVIQIESFKGIV